MVANIYEKGDKVRIIQHEDSVSLTTQVGLEGEVRAGGHNWYDILIPERGYYCFHRNSLELIETLDKVNPPHYKKGAVECIDAIKAATIGKSGVESYLVGNVIKYLWRYEDKGGVEDIKKGLWYLNRLLDERTT